MATHPSSLAWRIPMDRGGWQATVHGVAVLNMTEATYHAFLSVAHTLSLPPCPEQMQFV